MYPQMVSLRIRLTSELSRFTFLQNMIELYVYQPCICNLDIFQGISMVNQS